MTCLAIRQQREPTSDQLMTTTRLLLMRTALRTRTLETGRQFQAHVVGIHDVTNVTLRTLITLSILASTNTASY